MYPLLFAVISGILSAVIGSAGISGTFLFYIQQPQMGFDSSISSVSLGRLGIIICEILINLSYSVAGILLLVNKENKNLKFYSYILGTTRLLLFVIMMIIFWSSAWYFILDPVGKDKYAYAIIFFTIIQIILFFSVKKKDN